LGQRGGVKIDHENSYQVSVNGHGWEFGTNMIGNAATIGDRDILRYMKSRADSIAARLGAFRKDMWGSVASANIFPNFAFLPGYFSFRIFNPVGPHKTDLGTMRTFSPGGILEMDDGENWENCTSTNAGYVTRHQRLCYALAPSGREHTAELPGIVHRGQLSDANQREFYKRWAQLMDAASWAEVPMAAVTKHLPEVA
jgi:ethylbenzene dioxygenase alpha subunit